MSGEHTAFFYGTLMAPEVFFSVCYGDKLPPKAIRDLHTFTHANLNDHCRYRVQYADYPGVVPEKGRKVRGVYATGLTDANMKKLDYFEGSEYERVKVKVELLQKKDGKEVVGEVKDTNLYIFLCPKDLEKRDWDYGEFCRDRMSMWTRREWAFGDGGEDKATLNGAV
ncbi:Protein AIG2 [Tolypocladium paradoxum]|uniref:Putative gamma-glutamylcyclotransferase n=1 Tax=Tolypocladium paradoxum TaxID=94208 RepID=A0A2S4L0V5_9HYPO|nr:Protein AIG2 [Tolypocladium paradoxum]